jgi:hypothetical protein
MEATLSCLKDDDLFGKNNNVPNKSSFSGAHAMKLFAKHPSDTAKIEGH